MKATRVWIAALLLLGVVTIAPTPGLTQSGTGTISGMLKDAGGRAVSGLMVRATDVLDPVRSYESASDASGSFGIMSVPAGSYQVAARTANTPWIAKDASPLTDVKAGVTSNVDIVLIRLSQDDSAPARVSRDGMSTASIVGLAAGLGAAGLGVYAAVEANSTSDDVEELQDQLDDLNEQFQQFREEFDQFKREVASEFQRR